MQQRMASCAPTRDPCAGVETPALNKYLGIPYAAPPVGDLRWRPPQSPPRWRAPRDATTFANHCPQHASPFGFESTTEDCLYLNVFTPGKRERGRGHSRDRRHQRHKRHERHEDLPVMVWLHGGGLTVGESDDYDPTRLVQQGVVVVTLNYRLGYLGFLAHPALSAESGGGSGNYGLMDQQAALRWVQRNIERFGGDDDNVTIFGQSAGGLSVHSNLASPRAKGLFDRAIAQSGAYAWQIPSLAAAEASGTSAANQLGCADQSAACLRSAPLETILTAQPTTEGSIVPNVDGNVLPRTIGSAIESGDFNRVPVIEGTTHDEFTIFEILYVESMVGPVTTGLYPLVVQILDGTLGLAPTTDEILAQYPVNDYPSAGLAISAIGTDAIFACPARQSRGVALAVRAARISTSSTTRTPPSPSSRREASRPAATTPQSWPSCSTRTCAAGTPRSAPSRKRSPQRWWATGRGSRARARPAGGTCRSGRATASRATRTCRSCRRRHRPRPASRPTTSARSGTRSWAVRSRPATCCTRPRLRASAPTWRRCRCPPA